MSNCGQFHIFLLFSLLLLASCVTILCMKKSLLVCCHSLLFTVSHMPTKQLKCLTIYHSAATWSLRADKTNLNCFKILHGSAEKWRGICRICHIGAGASDLEWSWKVVCFCYCKLFDSQCCILNCAVHTENGWHLCNKHRALFIIPDKFIVGQCFVCAQDISKHSSWIWMKLTLC